MLPRCLSVILLIIAVPVARADSKPLNRPGMPLRPEAVEVRLIDGSRLFLTLTEEALSVATPYGKLQIKLADIQKVEFGIRVPPATARKIEAAVAVLESG